MSKLNDLEAELGKAEKAHEKLSGEVARVQAAFDASGSGDDLEKLKAARIEAADAAELVARAKRLVAAEREKEEKAHRTELEKRRRELNALFEIREREAIAGRFARLETEDLIRIGERRLELEDELRRLDGAAKEIARISQELGDERVRTRDVPHLDVSTRVRVGELIDEYLAGRKDLSPGQRAVFRDLKP